MQEEDCQRFIDSYPALRAEQQRRGGMQTRGGRGDARLYSHPYHWGAFIAMGL